MNVSPADFPASPFWKVANYHGLDLEEENEFLAWLATAKINPLTADPRDIERQHILWSAAKERTGIGGGQRSPELESPFGAPPWVRSGRKG